MISASGKFAVRILLPMTILLVAAASGFAQTVTTKDATFYLSDPEKWDGKEITIMVSGCYLDGTSKDKKTTIIDVYTNNGTMPAHVPSAEAKAFLRRYTNQYYNQRKILKGKFDAKALAIVVGGEKADAGEKK